MNVFASGFPKAGNHALVKACELLGVPAEVNPGVPFEQGLPEGTTHHIYLKRDPRNIVIALLRFQGREVTPKTFIACAQKLHSEHQEVRGGHLVAEMGAHVGWLTSGAHIVSYEDLIKDSQAMQGIAAYLDVPYKRGMWEQLPGMTWTWHEKHSDYREIWSPSLESAWKAEGGNKLLADWGYSKWKS